MTLTELRTRAKRLEVTLDMDSATARYGGHYDIWAVLIDERSGAATWRFVRTPLMGRGPTKAAARKQLYFRIWAFLHFVERITEEGK